jgi:zinc transport system substrate-binding protein
MQSIHVPRPRTLLLLVVLLSPAACGEAPSSTSTLEPQGPPVVQAVNYPLAYFAGRLAPGVDIRFEAPAGHDPAFWNPSGEAIRAFQQAALILDNGAGYAKWMQTATLPTGRIVDTSAGFRDALIDTGGGVTHSHGPDGGHTHGDTAFTTWLDFGQAQQQARAILEALHMRGIVPDPARGETKEARRGHELFADLHRLDEEMKALGVAGGKRPLFASHPVYQYAARAYGLNIKSEHFEPGVVPTEEELEILASLRKVFPAEIMLWEAEPGAETRAKLEGLGIRCVVFDPCGRRPASGDFLSVMRENVARLREALGP